MPILLATFYFFYFSIIGVYVIFLPKVLSMVGYSASEIGIVFAAAPLVRFIVPFAFIKGLKLNAKIFHIALFIMVGSAIGFYLSLYNFYALLLSNVCLGIGLSLILPYIELISLSQLGKERYGKIRLYGSIGFILVALVLVRFLTSEMVALNFLLALTFTTAIFASIIANKAKEVIKESANISNDINIFSDWQLWLGLSLMQVSFGAFYNFFTIYETDNGISLDMTINLWVFGVIAEVVMLYYQGRFLRNNLLKILQFTTAATVLRWFLVYAYPDNLTVMFIAQSMHALSFALFHSASISYLFHLYKNRSLAQQFFSGITYGLGGFIGALYSGYVYEYFPKELFLSASLIALLACVFLVLWEKRFKTCK